MPANYRHVTTLILQELESIEERCQGYRASLVDAIVDIITAERQHRIKGTNIQQRVDEKCNAVGQFLADQREHTT